MASRDHVGAAVTHPRRRLCMGSDGEDSDDVDSCNGVVMKTCDVSVSVSAAAVYERWRSSAPSTQARSGDVRSEAGGRRRERRLEEAWEMRRRSQAPARAAEEEEVQCRVLVRQRYESRRRRITMDREEVKACCDLKLGLPLGDLTVEAPAPFSDNMPALGVADSPIANWKIANPGDDPNDVKARLKIWAQAVALISLLRLN